MDTDAWDPEVLGVLMAPVPGAALPEVIGEALEAGLAAVVLGELGALDPPGAAALARAVHARAEHCVVAIQEEGGDLTRLQGATGSALPTARALGAVDDIELTRHVGRSLGDLLAACDLDLDLAPVLDVPVDPGNPAIGTRAFGDDPDRVAAHARAFATGLVEAGVGTCATHFPGLGAAWPGSAAALPRIDLDARTLERDHLAPWRIVPWLDGVVAAHVLVPSLGEGPASLSAWTRPLLDRTIGGTFHGLLLTEALDDPALAADVAGGEAAVRALEAGADLLRLGTAAGRDAGEDLRAAHDALRRAVATGRLPRETLRARAERTRERLRSLRTRRRFVPALPLEDALHRAERLGAEAARRAVRARHAALAPGPVTVSDLRSPDRRDTDAPGRRLVEALRDRGVQGTTAAGPDAMGAAGQVLALTRLPRRDPEEGRRLAALLARRPETILVHTGVPDAAPEHRRRVLALGAGPAMMRAVVALLLDGER